MRKFFRQSLLYFKALFGWLDPKIYLIMKIIDPSLNMIFYSLLVKYVYKSSDITPWIIGNAFLLCTRNSVFVVGSLLRNERYQGTLKLIVASPANKFLAFIARSFFNIFDAALTVTIGLLIGVFVFKIDLSGINYFQFSLSILIAMVGGMSIGLVLGSIALVIREIHMFLNVAAMLLFILTGASYPIERLPNFAVIISKLIPITRSIEASRMIAAKGSSTLIYTLLSKELLLSMFYIFVAYFLFKYFEKKSRVDAALDAY
ncbi:ABC transporter permease [Brassicibacter mesophilus]|jgi:ABC-2 type transport system permease protein|uniref:ABC transporter permease n=1 Tax=Brassicibacter mesophilus TaxID=745119 RepID=UPI003D1DA9B0